MAIASHNRRVHEAFARAHTPMVKGRWAVRAIPTAQTVAIEDSVSRNASLLVMCDVDCGFPSWDVEIATLAIDAFRSAYAHVDERLPTTEAVHHAINYALMAARLDAFQKIGRAPTQNNDAEATFDGVSLLAVVTEASQIDIAQIGTSQLWIQRDSQVYPIVSQPTTALRFMTRNLRADDRILVCTAAIADHITATEIAHVLANEPADNAVVASLMPGADTAAPTIATAACMTFRQSRSLTAQRPPLELRPKTALPPPHPQRVPIPATTDGAVALPTTLASLPVIGLLSMAMAALLITLFLLFQLPPLRLTHNAGITSGVNALEGTSKPSFALPPTLTPLPSAIQATGTVESAPSATPTTNPTTTPARSDRIQPTRASDDSSADRAGIIIHKLTARPSATPIIPSGNLRGLSARP